jgi:hypothetical protein
MRQFLFVQSTFEGWEQLIKFLRLDHRPTSKLSNKMRSRETFHIPRDDIQLPSVEARNEIGLLFVLNYLLKLEGEPE